jgi:hypothetical protein
MHKILIFTSTNKRKVKNELLYDEISEFLVQYSMLNLTHSDVMDFILDEDQLSFSELSTFLSVLFNRPFQNEDNCKNIEELLDWSKSFQFLSFLDEEIG